jgi:hypothetical protein
MSLDIVFGIGMASEECFQTAINASEQNNVPFRLDGLHSVFLLIWDFQDLHCDGYFQPIILDHIENYAIG